MIHRLPYLICIIVLWISQEATCQKADESDPRAMIQANFLYQFAANNNWPPEARKGKFVIGVVGQPDVYEHLREKYGSKPLGNQVIEVIELSELPPPGTFFHILFIDKTHKSELVKAYRDLKSKPTLLVANWEGAIQSGAQINFKTLDGNIRYQMNVQALEDRRITPGVKILQWKVD